MSLKYLTGIEYRTTSYNRNRIDTVAPDQDVIDVDVLDECDVYFNYTNTIYSEDKELHVTDWIHNNVTYKLIATIPAKTLIFRNRSQEALGYYDVEWEEMILYTSRKLFVYRSTRVLKPNKLGQYQWHDGGFQYVFVIRNLGEKVRGKAFTTRNVAMVLTQTVYSSLKAFEEHRTNAEYFPYQFIMKATDHLKWTEEHNDITFIRLFPFYGRHRKRGVFNDALAFNKYFNIVQVSWPEYDNFVEIYDYEYVFEKELPISNVAKKMLTLDLNELRNKIVRPYEIDYNIYMDFVTIVRDAEELDLPVKHIAVLDLIVTRHKFKYKDYEIYEPTDTELKVVEQSKQITVEVK